MQTATRLNDMINEMKASILRKLLPQEKTWESEKMMTAHDQLIILGWNMYRETLLEKLKLR